MLYKANILIAQ